MMSIRFVFYQMAQIEFIGHKKYLSWQKSPQTSDSVLLIKKQGFMREFLFCVIVYAASAAAIEGNARIP